MANLQQFIADAEAEQLANLLGMSSNPWEGAGKKLAAAEKAQREDAERAAREAADRAQKQRAADFAQALASRRSLHDELREADIRVSALEREFQAPAMLEAGKTFDEFQKWRRNGALARDAEMVYKAYGRYPPEHFLANVAAWQIEAMKEYGDLLQRRQREEQMRGHAVGVTEGAIRQMESGQTASPSFSVGILLARELGVTAEQLAFGEEGATGAAATAKANVGAVAALARRVDAIELELGKLRRRR